MFRRALEALVTENRIAATGETRWRPYRLSPALGHETDMAESVWRHGRNALKLCWFRLGHIAKLAELT
jgi:hypothetical protein